ncbi:xylulokinase [Demetria terragena]|uniref:xylulokinase n=1 Tax=Demetria terragena TaxID=63959 RepID=UPI00036C7685|nr:FGGY family carbohydrate kinase [Demetria terragena]
MGRMVAGVDSSTQSCKVVVCDAETGTVLREGRAAHPDGTAIDAGRWWEAYQLATADGLLDGVEAISVAGQQHGMVTLDDDDELVRDALLWNDTRSADAATDLIDEFGGASFWAGAVGLIPVASFTVSKVRWLAEHEPKNAEKVRTVVLPHDWLTGRILQEGNGFQRWTTDRGDASGTGYWSAREGEYRPEIVRAAFGRELNLPEVLGPSERAGQTSDGRIVAAGTGDNMGAALGLGLRPGDVVLSLGTSGTVFADHDESVADERGYVAGFASASGGHLPLVCTLNAARVLTAGASMLGTDLAGLDELAMRAEPGAGGLTMLPYLDGERTPNLPGATGLLGGITRTNATPENVARACVEGMLCNLEFSAAGLAAQGISIDRVLLIGGASKSQAVRALASTIFDAPVVIPASAEYVGLGAARQAAWALTGEYPDWKIAVDDELAPGDGAAGRRVREQYAALGARVEWA